MEKIHSISKSSELDALLEDHTKVVLIYFSADWCGPCKRLHPVIETVLDSGKYKNLQVCKIDVDKHADLAQRFNVRSIPSVFLYASGTEKAVQMGLVSRERLEGFIDQAYA